MPNNIIDSIQLSGTVYTIQGTSGGGSPTVELTQAEYDALVTAGTVASDTYYIITDATPVDVSQFWTSAQTQSAINQATSGKVNTSSVVNSVTSASTDSEIPTAKAVFDATQSGGGATYSAGTNISISSDTISCTLPIKIKGDDNTIFDIFSGSFLNNQSSSSTKTIIGGEGNELFGIAKNSVCFGQNNNLRTRNNYTYNYGQFVLGRFNTTYEGDTFTAGMFNNTRNMFETSFGQYNNSVSGSTTFGNSGNTLFSVGNGTSSSSRHNAFEIRQNGDIYLTSGGTDIKLQDHLGGGGSSINVVQTTGSSTTDVMSQDAVTTQLSGYVTTDTLQTISGKKIFTYSASSGGKAIEFKQTSDSAKVGFSVKNTADTNNEVASFEFRPNTFTIDNVQHPLMYFGHYRNRNIANAGVPQTVIGFRQYDQLNAAAYHYLMPLPEKAKTPFSLTTSFKDYYAPMGFKNGSTMITADNTGVADFSSVLGGLKLVKLSQSDYNALTTKDDNTVYFIGDSTNGYTMKIGSANVN